MENKVEIKEGTVVFVVKAGKVKYNNSQSAPLLQLNPEGGSILIVKDSDNKLKFFHIYLGKGRTDLEYDVSNLDAGKNHMFTFTWSVTKKEIFMYIDGKEVAKAQISY